MKLNLVFIILITIIYIPFANAVCTSVRYGQELCLHREMPILSQLDSTNGCQVSPETGKRCLRKIDTNNAWNMMFSKNQYAHGFWNQNYTMGLREHINKKYQKSFSKDEGWCGGVSAAMVLKTFARESRLFRNTLVGYPYLGKTNEFITWSFEVVGTSLKGGTDTSRAYRGLADVTRQFGREVDLPSIRNYKHETPLAYLSIGPSNGHVVSLNGQDGNFYKIYDAWGDIYNVEERSGYLYYVSGQHGYVKVNDGKARLKSSFALVPR